MIAWYHHENLGLMFLSSILKESLTKIAGENVSDDIADLIAYSTDAVGYLVGKPEFIVWPISNDQVVEIVKLANREKIPIVPRGAGSSLAGGCTPKKGGIVLDFSKMNRILEIDEKNLTVWVEPGVVLAKLNEKLAKYKLFFPPTPASDSIATFGGSINTNAGGLRAVKYGVMRDWVLGMEVILGTGEIINTGRKLRKCVSGYDINSLIVGSEGTLGIVTKALLKVTTLPEFFLSAVAFFSSLKEAGECIYEVIRRGIGPTAGEIIDKISLEAVSRFVGLDYPEECEAMVLFEVDGDKEEVEKKLNAIRSIFEEKNAIEHKVAYTPEENISVWAARKAAYPAYFTIKPGQVTEDITVPLDKFTEMIEKIFEVMKKYDVTIPMLGHCADGGIHPCIVYDPRDKDETERAHKAAHEIMDIALELDGTVTGEHGIGELKRNWLLDEWGPVLVRLLKEIKKIFDPNGILNPGKIFPPEEEEKSSQTDFIIK